jgi:TolB-like protein
MRIGIEHIVLVAVAVLPALGQKELPAAAASLAEEIAAGGKHQLAVVDFTDLQGQVTELGRFIAEEIALGFVVSKKPITVIDRIHLRSLLQEHKLASSGIIDPATARKLGEIAGVDALVTGTITPLGDNVRLVVKVMDTRTAQILAATSVNMATTKAIEELLSKGISSASAQPESALGRSAPFSNGGREVGVGARSADSAKNAVAAELEEITLTINLCRSRGDSIVCTIQLLNRGEDRRIRLGVGQNSRIIDQSGHEYPVRGGQLGASTSRGDVRSVLVKGVPISGAVNFGFDGSRHYTDTNEISSIAVLELNVNLDERGWHTLQFRNIPVMK